MRTVSSKPSTAGRLKLLARPWISRAAGVGVATGCMGRKPSGQRFRPRESDAANYRGRLKGDAVDFGEFLSRQRPVDRGCVLFDLLGLRGTGDDARDERLVRKPTHGQLQKRVPAGRREGGQLLDPSQISIVEDLAATRWIVGQARPGGQCRTALVLAGQQTAGERKVWQEAEAVPAHGAEQALFQIALKQAVFVLATDKRNQARALTDAERLLELCGGEIGAADEADLSRLLQIVERPEGLFDRRL